MPKKSICCICLDERQCIEKVNQLVIDAVKDMFQLKVIF